MNVFIYIHTYICINMCIYIYIHMYKYVYKYIYIYVNYRKPQYRLLIKRGRLNGDIRAAKILDINEVLSSATVDYRM